MLSSEERSGLVFTLVGVALVAVAVLFAIGTFDSGAPALRRDPLTRARTEEPALAMGGTRGRVVDARTGFGLADRTIGVRGVEGIADPWLAPADETAPGAFDLRGLPADRRCRLEISADGYVGTSRDVRVEAGRVHDLGDVALVQLATLAGQVVDATGSAIGGATVELLDRQDETSRTTTDAHGNFRFERRAPGRYVLSAGTPTGDRTARPVEVDASEGGIQRALVLEAFPTVAASGRFVLPFGSATLAGAIVQGVGRLVAADGSFKFEGLLAGPLEIVVLVEADRGLPVVLAVPASDLAIAIDPAAAVAVQPLRDRIVAQHEADLARLAVGPDPAADRATLGALRIRVVDAAGERVAGARIELARTGASAPERLRFTGRFGECLARDLDASGAWIVTARFGDLTASTTVEPPRGATGEALLTLARP